MEGLLNAPLIVAYALNIGILFVVLRLVLYKPVKKFLDEREARFRNREEEIERRDHETQADRARYDELLGHVKEESDGLIRDSRQSANRRAEEILSDAEKQAEEMIRQARRQIAEEQKQARQEMKDQIVDLAVDMAGRILEREVTAEDHRRIVERFLKSQRVG
jgi:F-type H+-transporting ATPase subunit b